MSKLTVRRIERLKEKGRYRDGPNLYLAVGLNGSSKSWVFRYEVPVLQIDIDERGERAVPVIDPRTNKPMRRERMIGIGSYELLSLEKARQTRDELRRQLKDGRDPFEVRQAKRAEQALEVAKRLTFKEAAVQYYHDHAQKWSSTKHAAQFDATLSSYVYPKLGRLSVTSIDTGLILDILKQPVSAKPNLPAGPFYIARPETAGRVRQRIEAVLDWCIAHRYRTGDNPARLAVVKAALPNRQDLASAKKKKHHASMDYRQLPSFIAELRKREGVAARALEFTILTASRTNETVGALWSEFDFDEQVWTISAERMKAREEHRVPLSERAFEILQGMPREAANPHVFLGARNERISTAAMAAVLERMQRFDVTVHGMRSSFRTWGEEQTAYPHIVLEMALAHKPDSRVVRAYRRTDLIEKRKRLMRDWAAYLDQPSQIGGVVPMRRMG
jgi:integrase